MDSKQLQLITHKLRDLHDIMSMLVPIENIREHPFDYFKAKLDKITSFIDKVIEETLKERQMLENKITCLKETLDEISNDLELCKVDVPDIHNLYVLKEYLENEIREVSICRKKTVTEIEIIKEEIRGMMECLGMNDVEMCDIEVNNAECKLVNSKDELGDDKIDSDDIKSEKGLLYLYNTIISDTPATKKGLESIKQYYKCFRDEKERREQNRSILYHEILELLKRLDMNDEAITIDQKIFILEAKHKRYQNEVKLREAKLAILLKEVQKREKFLCIDEKRFVFDLSCFTIEEVEKYNRQLKAEQKKQFGVIYERTRGRLLEISATFGVQVGEYEFSETGVEDMQRKIDELEPKRDLYLKLVDMIDRRKSLIEKMNEFERIASDPRRLFKSSFQLISEEKFRKSAYPTLIKMEESVFETISEYECKFGELFVDGNRYRDVLKQEIENRIVNRTVFINRFDSPVKKKRS